MIKKIYSYGIFFAIAVAFLLILCPQMGKSESPRTITLQSGEVVCDLNGEWTALYENYGQCSAAGNQEAILQIKQEGNKFVAIKLSGGGPADKGTEVIRGELDQKGLKKAEMNLVLLGLWENSEGEIADACKKIIINNVGCVKGTLQRK
jgi:hypothetical protein